MDLAGDVRVLKFGGSALRDGGAVRRALEIVESSGGPRPVLVVSAHGTTTDLLDRAARAAAVGRVDSAALRAVRLQHRGLLADLGLDPERCDRYLALLTHVLEALAPRGNVTAQDLDLVLSLGERMSARIVAAALNARGLTATPVDAWDLGFRASRVGPLARITSSLDPLIRERTLELSGIPVVTGFLAKDEGGQLATLGRDGSDLSAAILAAALGAEQLILWKTVAGVSSADPTLVEDAHVLEHLTWLEARALARAGASVLHPEAVTPVLRAKIPVRIADVRAPSAAGTRVGAGRSASESAGGEPIALVTPRPSGDRAELVLVGARPTLVARALALLSQAGIDTHSSGHEDNPVPLLRLSVDVAARTAAARALHAGLVGGAIHSGR